MPLIPCTRFCRLVGVTRGSARCTVRRDALDVVPTNHAHLRLCVVPISRCSAAGFCFSFTQSALGSRLSLCVCVCVRAQRNAKGNEQKLHQQDITCSVCVWWFEKASTTCTPPPLSVGLFSSLRTTAQHQVIQICGKKLKPGPETAQGLSGRLGGMHHSKACKNNRPRETSAKGL